MKRLGSRTRLAGILVAGLLALATGVSQGLASALGSSTGKAPIIYRDDSCGTSTGTNYVGTASFSRNKDTLTVRVKMRGMDPGSYHLLVWGAPCDFLADLGKFNVNAGGDGEKSGQTSTFGYKKFFVVIRSDIIGDSNSTYVKLG